MLFAPWVFARQINRCASLSLGLVFALLCFVPGSIVLIVQSPDELWFLTTWVLTAAVYILVQTVLLALLDPARRGAWRRTLGFWLCVGFYTTAIVATEFVCGPPVVTLEELGDMLFERAPYQALEYFVDDDRFLWAPQLLLWSAGLAVIFHHRCRLASWRRRPAILASVFLALGLLLLFVLHIDYVAMSILALIDRWFDVLPF